MSATITLAKEETSGFVQHINDVTKERGLMYRCVGCDTEMIVVKSKARKRDWHFRHSVESDCSGGRDTALHDYAVQILLENTSIKISKTIQIEYDNPRKEVSVLGIRSDVTVKYDNGDVHFEVFVTHDLSQEKVGIYKANKIKCVRLNLSNPDLLSASPESINEAVLKEHRNKIIIYWEDEPVQHKPESFNLVNILLGILAAIGVTYLFKMLLRRRR